MCSVVVLRLLLSRHTLHVGRDTKFTVAVFIFYYGNGFFCRGFTDRREILQGGSATSGTDLLPFCGDRLGDGRVLGVNRNHMAECASCYVLLAFIWRIKMIIIISSETVTRRTVYGAPITRHQ